MPLNRRGIAITAGRFSMALAGLMIFADDAAAQLAVCNQTLDVVNVAVGKKVAVGPDVEVDQTEGWWTIGANRCVDVIREPLVNRFLYVYAKDVFGQAILNGTTKMCVGSKRFLIEGSTSCWERGHSAVPFIEVDTQAVERWTLFVQERPGT